MFNNPGEKIKNLAMASFIVETIAAIIGGIVLMCEDYVFLGFVTILGGFFVAYVTALLLYGFGELVENSANNQPDYHEMLKALQADFSSTPKSASVHDNTSNDAAQISTNRNNTAVQKFINSTPQTPVDHSPSLVQKVVAATPSPEDPTKIVCPNCGTSQLSNRKVCFNCGAKFQ